MGDRRNLSPCQLSTLTQQQEALAAGAAAVRGIATAVRYVGSLPPGHATRLEET
jgi:hypothetical protein